MAIIHVMVVNPNIARLKTVKAMLNKSVRVELAETYTLQANKLLMASTGLALTEGLVQHSLNSLIEFILQCLIGMKAACTLAVMSMVVYG